MSDDATKDAAPQSSAGRRASERREMRDRIVAAALPHAAFDGWTMKALLAGAADAGLPPGTAERMFPRGPAEAAEHLSAWADRRMLDRLEAMDLESMRMRDRVAAAVRARLEVLAHHREAVRRVLGFMALPINAGVTSRCTYRTVDAIWYAVGDRSVDFSFYTKRALLTAVYSSTVLYWLADASEDFADTWSFLDRRIADVMRIPRLKGRLTQPFERLLRAPRARCGRPSTRRTV